MAKSRWEIENQGSHAAKNRHGMQHICHHETNGLVVEWLIRVFALIIERLYRLRHLDRGARPVRTAMELVRQLWLALWAPRTAGSS
jgi:hypothetical protein